MGRSVNSSGSGLLNPNATGVSSLVSVTARDAFADGDLVFIDTATGNAVNLNTSPASLAVTAGLSVFVPTPAVLTATGTHSVASASVQLADGSYFVFSAGAYSATETNQRLVAYKFSKQGVLQRGTANFVILGSTPPATQSVVAQLMANGNVIVCVGASASVNNFVVFNSVGEIVSSIGITASGFVNAIQTTTDNNTVLVHSNTGVYRISLSAGTATSIISYAGNGVPGENLTNGHVSTARSFSNWFSSGSRQEDQRFFQISSGGWGILVNYFTGVQYLTFNADGTSRLSTGIGGAMTSVANLKFAVGASGNILYVFNNSTGTSWGIVSDSGSTVKAIAAIASSDTSTNGSTAVIADAAGDFFFCWTTTSGAVLNSNWVTAAAGTNKSNFPRTDNMSVAIEAPFLFRLSTGIVVITPTGTTGINYSLFSNAQATVVTLKSITQNGVNQTTRMMSLLSGNVFNDALYLAGTEQALTTGDLILYAAKIDNTGAITTTYSAGNSDVTVVGQRPVLTVDANEVTVFIGGPVKRYKASDLTHLNTSTALTAFSNWLPAVSGNASQSFLRVAKYGTTMVVTTSAIQQTSGYNEAYLLIKPEDTRLIGVAAADAPAGGKVEVQTKGSASCTWTWSGSFDQSGAVPAGNKGSINQQIVHLLGVNGV